MSGNAVIQPPGGGIDPCQEQAGQRREHPAELAIHARHDRLRFRARGCMRAHQSHQARGPHAGRQAFAADVAKGDDHGAACLLDGEEITGQVANGEYLAGNLDVPVPHETRSAQAPMHLRSFEHGAVEIRVILLERRELPPQLPVMRPKT